ncbi:MAG: lactonase family protein [Planctomycetota bacterium]|nr:lactonase family protein [Planctomycetota bacterium]
MSITTFISSFAPGDEGSIHACNLDADSGSFELINEHKDVENPFFLALGPGNTRLYSIHVPGGFGDAGQVVGFNTNLDTGELTRINAASAHGGAACYVDVDGTGKVVVAANYGSGDITSLPVNDDGSLGEPASHFQHEGSSVDESRQQGPHAHCIVVSPDNKYVYSNDLGLDKIMNYKLDVETATLAPNKQPFARTLPGAGPRHFAFHPSKDFAYAINELHNSVTVFIYEPDTGSLLEQQTISTLPDDWEGTSHTADVKLTPDGRFLYGTNRGHDSIAIYSVGDDGLLTLVGIEPSLGGGPQNLAITPDGSLLIVANMPDNKVVTFRINADTGEITHTGATYEIKSPSCIMLAV